VKCLLRKENQSRTASAVRLASLTSISRGASQGVRAQANICTVELNFLRLRAQLEFSQVPEGLLHPSFLPGKVEVASQFSLA
jgi:hypothetical protein